MSRLTLLPALLALLACAPNEEPPRAPAEAPKVVLQAKPSAPAPQPPAATPAPSAPPAPAASPKPLPRRESRRAEVHLPAFTFRTMDHRHAKVFLNGEELSETPCLWTITETIEFDPSIPVAIWPPEKARYAGATTHPENPAWKAEVYIGDAPADEAVVFVDASIQGRSLRGALRLRVPDYRWIHYDPLVAPDGEDASRLQRTLWLERTKNE
jgi:hypothetical protein